MAKRRRKSPSCNAWVRAIVKLEMNIVQKFVAASRASRRLSYASNFLISKVFIFYIDMRMYGYWENEIYWPAQEKYKVNYIKACISEVLPKGGSTACARRRYDDEPPDGSHDGYDRAFGWNGAERGTRAIAQLLDIQQNKYGFIESGGVGGLDPVATSKEGIFVAGAASGPADLDDSISTSRSRCSSCGSYSFAK